MDNMVDNDVLSTRYDLFDGLNEHGFLFEEKCASVLSKNSSQIKWTVLSREFPVSVNSHDTRIDLVLRDDLSTESIIYAVIECKRVNPNRAHWLFGNPNNAENNAASFINLSSQHDRSGNYRTLYSLRQLSCSKVTSYIVDNWWLEQRTYENKRVISPNPIESTLLQVNLGVTGLGRELELQWSKTFPKQSVLFIPVILTTAPLFIASYDVEDVDLTTGDISVNKVNFGPAAEIPQQANWLLVNYSAGRSTSPAGLHEASRSYDLKELEQYYKRAIFVVNSEHIAEFFAKLHCD